MTVENVSQVTHLPADPASQGCLADAALLPGSNVPSGEIQPRPEPPSSQARTERPDDRFVPVEPDCLEQTKLTDVDVQSLVLKTLLNAEVATGRQVADQIKLPFVLVQQVLQSLKGQMLVAHAGVAPMSDYQYELSETGTERAQRYNQQCTYCGAAPVALEDYTESVRKQSIRRVRPRLPDLCAAYRDLVLPPGVISQIGQALYAGRALLLYGPTGNGKSSVAQRVMRCLDQEIWIPRTITVGHELIRLYDPNNHEQMPLEGDGQLLSSSRIDRRWVRIRRPIVLVEGQLTLDHLDITANSTTGINEAPLQLKSNCGTLVIDDFGRQRVSVDQLLNRWMVPLEKGFDYVALPSGRQIQVPFDQLLVVATNLEPKQLLDEAFLRRIPYKIEMKDPTEQQFRELFDRLAPQFGFQPHDEVVRYLVSTHFTSKDRPLRFGYVRAILQQAKNYCEFHERPLELTPETIDVAMTNYFAGLD